MLLPTYREVLVSTKCSHSIWIFLIVFPDLIIDTDVDIHLSSSSSMSYHKPYIHTVSYLQTVVKFSVQFQQELSEFDAITLKKIKMTRAPCLISMNTTLLISTDKLQCCVLNNRSLNSESSPLVTCKISWLGNYQNLSYKQYSKATQNRESLLWTGCLKPFCTVSTNAFYII